MFLVHTAHDRFNIAEFTTRLISAIACVNANSSAAATLFWHAKMLGVYLSAFVLQVFCHLRLQGWDNCLLLNFQLFNSFGDGRPPIVSSQRQMFRRNLKVDI